MAKRTAAQPALPLFPPNASIDELRKEAAHCKACDLWKNATQTVFGEGGGAKPKVIFVGEQPGDQEDIEGKPFVGPAGKLLDSALVEAGIDRKKVYVTKRRKTFQMGSHVANAASTKNRTPAKSPPAAHGSTPKSQPSAPT